MSVSLRKKKTKQGFSLYLDCYQYGRRWYEFLGIVLTGKDKAVDRELKLLAESIRSKRLIEISSSNHGLPSEHLKRSDFFTYCNKYIKRIIDSGKDEQKYASAVKTFRSFYGKDILQFRAISTELLLSFKNYLNEKYSGETPHDYFKRLRSIVRAAIDEGYLQSDPSRSIRNVNTVHGMLRKEALTLEELQKLTAVGCGNPQVRRAFLFACQTGLRLGDLQALTWQQIDLDRLEVIHLQGKTSKVNRVPLNKTALELLGERGSHSERVFSIDNNYNSINRILEKWVRKAGIDKHVTFHCSRHTFISLVLLATGNLKLASALAGHSSSVVTEKYAHLIDKSKRDAVDRIGQEGSGV